MILPTLYSRTSTGAVQQWTLEIEGDGFRTIHGQVDGKLQTTEWTKCLPKNEGKKNATTAEEQALKEGKATWKKKKETGYFEDINDIDIQLFTEPMLAKNYDDYKDELEFPVISQPKLDGIRCIARKDGLWSRKGKRITSVPHIEEALKPLFEKNEDLILDGELYCDKFANDFNSICSMVRKEKPNAEELQKCKETIEYHIYDIVVANCWDHSRRATLTAMAMKNKEPSLKFVESTYANNEEALDVLYGKYLEQNYEGQMVRTNGMYEHKRSKNLLKRKTFQDREDKIVEVIEGIGNRTGTAGAIVMEDARGVRYKTNIMGSREYVAHLWEIRDTLPGQLGTVVFFNLTPDGIPRFPYLKTIRPPTE